MPPLRIIDSPLMYRGDGEIVKFGIHPGYFPSDGYYYTEWFFADEVISSSRQGFTVRRLIHFQRRCRLWIKGRLEARLHAFGLALASLVLKGASAMRSHGKKGLCLLHALAHLRASAYHVQRLAHFSPLCGDDETFDDGEEIDDNDI
jgi:hypothetical protein